MSKDKISVPRELLERWTTGKLTADDSATIGRLLTQPNTCTKDGGQGEPVVLADAFGEWFKRNPYEELTHATLGYMAFKAGAVWRSKQSPTVSQAPVVLPERKPIPGNGVWHFLQPDYLGWNACLDEFKRLNPGITEAD